MNTNLNMQTMSIDQLTPAKYNPRKDLKPGDPAYKKIKCSLHDFGYVDPIVWNEVTGNIVSGHQRYKVLKAEGDDLFSKVPSSKCPAAMYSRCRRSASPCRI